MSFVRCLRGIASGREYDPDRPMNLDPADGRPVEIVIDLERLAHERPHRRWYEPARRDMWRFGGLLALDVRDRDDARHIVSLGEGCTPLIDYADHPLASSAGFDLSIKEEGCARPGFGANPTRSFKDRGMAMVVSQARRLGIKRLAVPTQGNAGDALVRYGIEAGLQVAVVLPADTPVPILASIEAAVKRYPRWVELHRVEGTIREAGAWLRQHLAPRGFFSVATFQEPGWRIEGKKTLGLELAEPAPGDAHWSLPDAVVYPTGGGTGVLGMWKAWAELEALGLIGAARPRMLCVQSAVTQPLVLAFDSAAQDTVAETPRGTTLATGLNVPAGVGHFRVLEIIRESGGAAVAVSEAALTAELTRVWRHKRWWLAPEGAACLAALPELLDRGLLRHGERVVAVNTGALDKYLPSVGHLM
ncbi:MAG TPA: threonine synthase [Xanthomonadaceae bacterium]|nr:threonine synthase [Xanthomonadaceae bacterium]